MAEYLYVELRTRERPYYVRVEPDGLHYVDARCQDLNKIQSVADLRAEARRVSRAIPCETMAGVVLVPV